MATQSSATRARAPVAKVGADAVRAAQVMVDAFRLRHEAPGDDAILNGILDGLASLVHLDAAGVYIIDAAGERLHYTLVRGCDIPAPQLRAPFGGKGAIGEVITTGKPLSVTAAGSPAASEGRSCARSRLLVPIVGTGSRVLGVLDVWSDHTDGYDETAVELLRSYGLAVAGTIEGDRLQAAMVDKRRLDSDLALARQVMDDLLPQVTPSLPGFDISGVHETSLEVGGDYYEFIPLVDDRWGVVIADVVGKGIAAALLVSTIRASFASLVGHELALRVVLRRANRFFHESVEEGKFVTLFYAVVDVPRRRMIYVNASHMPPVLLRASGEVELLEEGGVPLGLFEAPGYFEGHAALTRGDLLALYADGIVEAMDAEETQFGRDRLVRCLQAASGASATEICSSVMQDVRRFGSSHGQDDRTLVVLKAT